MKQSLARVASDSELNQFVRDFVGEMVVEADGGIRPKEAAVPGGQMAEAIQYRRLDRRLGGPVPSLHGESGRAELQKGS